MVRALVAGIALTLVACGGPRAAARVPEAVPLPSLGIDVCASAPAYAEASTFFASAEVEDATSFDVPSNGDLWPSCSTGTTLLTAWGDGFGFAKQHTGPRPSIGVGELHGLPWDPPSMQGQNLVVDRDELRGVFRVWTRGKYYAKPTGMLCRGGKIYLAVEDVNHATYEDAPAATIAESSDGGVTWTEGSTPMFTRGAFTTIMFLDSGPDAHDARDGYDYAYGLDFNFGGGKPHAASPQALYLARVERQKSPRDPNAWEFFSGEQGDVMWSRDVAARKPVLVDCTRRHAAEVPPGHAVIGQGGIVYDGPLARYLYTSWSEYTFEFYEAPAPWGPWRRFLSKDFGTPPWTAAKHGGYATNAPSLWMSRDGKTLWVQSNTWSAGIDHNDMAIRKLTLEPR